jgi:hypothetical protein
MRGKRRAVASRDQELSTFGSILLGLCESSGARGAALVDQEGETVDYGGRMDPFEIRVAAAEWRLVLSFVRATPFPGWPSTTEIVIRARERSYAIVGLAEGYAIVLELSRHCFRVSARALAQAARELEPEAGLGTVERPSAPPRRRWARVRVQTAGEDKSRPEAVWIEGAWNPVTILGRYRRADLGRREVGYLARLPSGAEFSLVREPFDRWFADELA